MFLTVIPARTVCPEDENPASRVWHTPVSSKEKGILFYYCHVSYLYVTTEGGGKTRKEKLYNISAYPERKL
jgi:hypothetical protein